MAEDRVDIVRERLPPGLAPDVVNAMAKVGYGQVVTTPSTPYRDAAGSSLCFEPTSGRRLRALGRVLVRRRDDRTLEIELESRWGDEAWQMLLFVLTPTLFFMTLSSGVHGLVPGLAAFGMGVMVVVLLWRFFSNPTRPVARTQVLDAITGAVDERIEADQLEALGRGVRVAPGEPIRVAEEGAEEASDVESAPMTQSVAPRRLDG